VQYYKEYNNATKTDSSVKLAGTQSTVSGGLFEQTPLVVHCSKYTANLS